MVESLLIFSLLWEDTVRRQPSPSQEESRHQNLTMLAPSSRISGLQPVRKKKKNSLKTSSLWYFVVVDSTDWDETPSGSCKVTISTFIHLYFYCAWSGCRNFSQMLRLLETTMLITLQMLVLIASLEKKCVCLIIDII